MNTFGTENITKSAYPNAEVRVEKAQFSIIHLKRMVEVRDEMLINPEFQRHKVWSQTQRSELVESVLMGIPIPVFYLFENRYGQKQVVDGKQRITALLDYMNNVFPLKKLRVLQHLNGLRFSELSPQLQAMLEDFQLLFYIVQPPTSERVKYDIFDRVNRGGTPLSNQEMRNALYYGKATELAKRICISDAFLRATDKSIAPERMRDAYVVLRTLAFFMLFYSHHYNIQANLVYSGDIDDFLATFMMLLNEKTSDDIIKQIENDFLVAMDNIYTSIGPDAFRFPRSQNGRRRPFNMLLFEILTILFIQYRTIAKRISKNEWDDFRHSCDKEPCFKSGTDSLSMIIERIKFGEDFIIPQHQ